MSVPERWKRTRPITLSSSEAARRASAELEGDSRVLIAYLFGSRSNDTSAATAADDPAPDDRDIDLAIYTSREFGSEDYVRAIERLGGALGTDRLDLVWLNCADPTMTFQVIRDGVALFYRDADTLNDFERKAKHRYYDYQIYLRRHRARRRSAVGERRGR